MVGVIRRCVILLIWRIAVFASQENFFVSYSFPLLRVIRTHIMRGRHEGHEDDTLSVSLQHIA